MSTDISIDPTPNPNSLKFSCEGSTFIHSGLVSVSSVAEAEGDPFIEDLISIEGVGNVFILPQFVTISKQASGSWNDIVPKVETILKDRLSR